MVLKTLYGSVPAVGAITVTDSVSITMAPTESVTKLKVFIHESGSEDTISVEQSFVLRN